MSRAGMAWAASRFRVPAPASTSLSATSRDSKPTTRAFCPMAPEWVLSMGPAPTRSAALWPARATLSPATAGMASSSSRSTPTPVSRTTSSSGTTSAWIWTALRPGATPVAESISSAAQEATRAAIPSAVRRPRRATSFPATAAPV